MLWTDFDIKKLFRRLSGNKLWILFSMATALGLGKLYILYTVPAYKVQCSILLRDQDINEDLVNEALPNAANLYSTSKEILQQIRLLKSPALMEEVVEQLRLGASLYEKGRFLKTALYKDAPVEVDTAIILEKGYGVDFMITIIDSISFQVVAGKDSLQSVRFGNWARLPASASCTAVRRSRVKWSFCVLRKKTVSQHVWRISSI